MLEAMSFKKAAESMAGEEWRIPDESSSEKDRQFVHNILQEAKLSLG